MVSLNRRQKIALGAVGVGAGVGIAHFATHNLAGDPAAFGRAGVTEAGLASAGIGAVGAAALVVALS